MLAFQPAKPDPIEERWAELRVEEAEFVFLGDLREREQESTRAELRSAQVVFRRALGAVTPDFTVYVSTNQDLLNQTSWGW